MNNTTSVRHKRLGNKPFKRLKPLAPVATVVVFRRLSAHFSVLTT